MFRHVSGTMLPHHVRHKCPLNLLNPPPLILRSWSCGLSLRVCFHWTYTIFLLVPFTSHCLSELIQHLSSSFSLILLSQTCTYSILFKPGAKFLLFFKLSDFYCVHIMKLFDYLICHWTLGILAIVNRAHGYA